MPTALTAQAPSLAPPADVKPDQTDKPVFEEWTVLLLDSKQCGYGSTITTRIETPNGPQFHTEHQEEFVVKRFEANLKIVENFKITEDADGGVLSFEQTTSGVGSSITCTGTREGDDLVVTGRGETQRYHIPRLGALGPEKIRQLSNAVPLKAGQPFSFNTFSSDYPQAVVTVKGTVVAQETRKVRGKERNLWKLSSDTSILPGLLSTSWVDDQSNDVESLTVIPGIGDLHEYVSDRAECMKQPEGADIFTPNVLHPQRAIPSPGDQEQAVYRLILAGSSDKMNLWDQGEQHVLSSTPGNCEIEVTNHPISPSQVDWQLPHADTTELHPYLQASTYLEVNAPEIQALSKQAVGQEKNPVRAAHLIEAFVRDYITKKDLNIGFASAQETAKSREGDCTEHAVLCAALGRAAGLPTRCVIGFGYIPPGEDDPAIAETTDANTGIFGFHMWAEAWAGPDLWVPMDAALNGFDVGHIAITKTALEEINPLVDLNGPVLQLMENLQILVLKTVPKGRAGDSSPSSPPPTSSRSSDSSPYRSTAPSSSDQAPVD